MDSQYLIPYDWNVVGENNLIIHIWCQDRDSNRHLVRIEDYKATAYIELPRILGGFPVKWDRRMAAQLYGAIRSKNKCNPIEYMLEYGEGLYGLQTGCTPYLRLKFNSLKDMRSCHYALDKGIKFERTFIKLNLIEMDVDICRKLATEHELSFCNWMKVTGIHPKSIEEVKAEAEADINIHKDALGNVSHKSHTKFYLQKSKLPVEREWIVSHNDIEAIDPDICFDWTSHFRLMGIDAEQYSNNHRIFPEATNINHKAFMLSCVFQIEGDESTRERYCIILGDANEIPEERLKNSYIIKVKNEMEMMTEFHKLTELKDPEIYVGYNLDYDLPMLDTRQKIHNKAWPNISCLLDYNVKLDTYRWESSGYGHNEVNKLDMPGRIAVDMYPVIRRGHKLLRYNLDTVAKHFLGKNKYDVSPVEMFLTFERNQRAIANYAEYSLNLGLDENTVLDYRKDVDKLLKLVEPFIQARVDKFKEIPVEERININKESFDDYNDPANSPIFDRLGELNWCSNQLWGGLCEAASEAIATEIEAQEIPLVNAEILGELAAARYIMTRVAIYCAIDSDLCIDLMGKLNTCTDLRQMSDVTGITITDTFTRGQQIRVMSQLYDTAYHNKRCRIPKCKEVNCQDDTCLRTKCHDPTCENEHCRVDRCDKINCNDAECFKTKCHKADCSCPHIFEENRKGTDYKPVISRYRVFLTKRETTSSKYGGGFVFDVISDVYDGAIAVDFSSLYPSIMQEYNTCYTTLINPRDFHNFGDDISFTIKIPIPKSDKDIDIDNDEDSIVDEDDEEYIGQVKEAYNDLKDAFKNLVQDDENYYVKFVRPEIKRGILPHILNYLVRKRKEVRAIQANYPKGSFEWNKLESKQLALKVTANSVYGFTGAGKTGRRPIPELAAAVTSQGQKLIKFVNEYAEKKYGAYIVYGDTDSSFIQLPSLNKTQYVEMGKVLAKEISNQFGQFLNLEFEKAMKGIFIKKKHYVGYTYNEDGTFEIDKNTGRPKLFVRGIALARRDNSRWLLNVYEELVHYILGDYSFYDTMAYLIDQIKKLLSGDVDYNNLVMVRGVGATYKNDKYFMKMFVDNLRNSGTPVKAGERLGYIVTQATNSDQEKYVGNRMMLPKTYEELRYMGNAPAIDYMYYLENQSMNKLDPLFFAGFRKSLSKYQYIKCRPTTRHKNVDITTPLKMITKMLSRSNFSLEERDIFLDKILISIRAIDEDRYEQIPLCAVREKNGYDFDSKEEQVEIVIEDDEYFMF